MPNVHWPKPNCSFCAVCAFNNHYLHWRSASFFNSFDKHLSSINRCRYPRAVVILKRRLNSTGKPISVYITEKRFFSSSQWITIRASVARSFSVLPTLCLCTVLLGPRTSSKLCIYAEWIHHIFARSCKHTCCFCVLWDFTHPHAVFCARLVKTVLCLASFLHLFCTVRSST